MSSPDSVAETQREGAVLPGTTDDGDTSDGEIRDELPEDLQPEFAGAYRFPDNSRRRIPGAMYLGLAAVCAIAWAVGRDSSSLINGGVGWAAVVLGLVGLFSIAAGWRMRVDEKDALVAAQQAIGFPVGHASAQQVWHGFRSRPTWRVLCYSAEDPPRRRGLVLVDAVDGRVLQHLAEDNTEAWPGDRSPRTSGEHT